MQARAKRRAAGAVLAAILLSACTSSVAPPSSPTPSDTASESPVAVVIEDPWVKATDEGMTGAFGTVVNGTDRDLRAVAAASPLTERVELHEILSQGTMPVMTEMADGFLVPAGGSYILEPGGPHVMLMALSAPIEAGEDVEITLHFDDGTSVTWDAPARTYSGAGEEYMGDGDEDGSE